MEDKTGAKVLPRDKMKICELLYALNKNKAGEKSAGLIKSLNSNITAVEQQIELNYNELNFENLTQNTVDKYIVLNFYLLNTLKSILMESNDALNVLSVQQNKIIRDLLVELITIGIRYNLQPKLPQLLKPPDCYTKEEKTLTTDYNRLCYTTKWLIDLLPCDVLRPLIVIVGFESILNALYQIVYCPLKKPQKDLKQEGVQRITEEMYANFIKDKSEFTLLLKMCEELIPKQIYVKETMLLLKSDCVWFKKAVSQQLTSILRSNNGPRIIINSLLENTRDYDLSDNSKSWRALDVVVKLVCSLRKSVDFESNICAQIRELVNMDGASSGDYDAYLPFEMIFVSCTKILYKEDIDLCRRQFLPLLFRPMQRFLQDGGWNGTFQDGDDITITSQINLRLLKMCFAGNDVHENNLPTQELFLFIVVIFRLYGANGSVNLDEKMTILKENMAAILLKVISENFNATIDIILFNLNSKRFRTDLCFKITSCKVLVSLDQEAIIASNSFAFLSHSLLKFLNSLPKKLRIDCQIKFFLYLLSCLTNKERYFSGDSSAAISQNLIVYTLLSSLAEDSDVQYRITQEPKEIVSYISNVLHDIISRNAHKSESNDFRTAFLLIMILQALVTADDYTATTDVSVFRLVLKPLRTIRDECANEELAALVTSVISTLDPDVDNDKHVQGKVKNHSKAHVKQKSELDKAIDDVCDPLLPVRAHGLMILAKLIEQRHPEALERKIFVLNVFQQNIKNQDSFIYLSAINGLALMGDLFPDTVLETLTDEYVGFDQTSSGSKTATNDNSLEMRMKLGEVLIKVTRNLGDKAPKYKSLLINTFMLGTKDDDHLMRASSLSNLGEVCQVLGYKLGAIVNEILECIHTVITEDPAVEVRRAAVTVIRQLFIGLRTETLSFLQDDIQEVYKTLRRIYTQDEDDVMRLQAQLALEELEVNIKEFLFPNKLQEEKKAQKEEERL